MKAEMLVRRPVPEVFEAFVNPELTTRFWFTRGSGSLQREHGIELNVVADHYPDAHVQAAE